MSFNKSVIETMRKRQSIRTYDTLSITESDNKNINDYIHNHHNLIGPFGTKGRIDLVQIKDNVTDKGTKLGTYGFIKDPRGYLVGVAENSKYSLLDFAYCFQKLVI